MFDTRTHARTDRDARPPSPAHAHTAGPLSSQDSRDEHQDVPAGFWEPGFPSQQAKKSRDLPVVGPVHTTPTLNQYKHTSN